MKISSLKRNQLLYSVESYRMGNTTMRTCGVYLVRILDVADDFVVASWSGNRPKKYYDIPSSWRVSKPYMVNTGFGTRKATRSEIKNLRWSEGLCSFVPEKKSGEQE